MRQIIQDLKSGETQLAEIPAPLVRPGHVLVQTTRSLVSLGTERMLVEFGSAGLVQKARQQPEKVKVVLDKVRSDGLAPTLEAVFNKLGQPLPLGNCNVGRVIDVGDNVSSIRIGDRVVSNSPHAEVVCAPLNLCARIPEDVSDEAATFTVVGSIGLQGIRLLEPTFGETVVVIGLGLIGLLSAQLLLANGCNVIGVDVDQRKVDLAARLGVRAIKSGDGNEPVKFVLSESSGIGADAVLISAATKSNEIIGAAARMSRKRGRIVLVGSVGLSISRADFYEKELRFQVSCSYGPGRYDENYEQHGRDYPIGYVRWTEKRNFDAILYAIAAGRLNVEALITEVVPLEDFSRIYDNIGTSTSIASIFQYNEVINRSPAVIVTQPALPGSEGVIGIIGAGNFTSATVIPALRSLGVRIKYLTSAGGLTARTVAKKVGVELATTDYRIVLEDPDVDLVMITTRHNLHASIVCEALKAGKHVFVEKPLCLSEHELREILDEVAAGATKGSSSTLTVGFNRRFSPFAKRMRDLIGDGAVNIVVTMNAGFIPETSWVHDLRVGGGRIVGEACHLIDLCSYLTGSHVTAVCMNALGNAPKASTDNASILMRLADGSNAIINYFANGSKAYAKERIEVYSQERTLVLDNWRTLTGFGFSGFNRTKSKLDKGHARQFQLLVERLNEGGDALIPLEEIVNTTRASFAAITSLQENRWVELPGA